MTPEERAKALSERLSWEWKPKTEGCSCCPADGVCQACIASAIREAVEEERARWRAMYERAEWLYVALVQVEEIALDDAASQDPDSAGAKILVLIGNALMTERAAERARVAAERKAKP